MGMFVRMLHHCSMSVDVSSISASARAEFRCYGVQGVAGGADVCAHAASLQREG